MRQELISPKNRYKFESHIGWSENWQKYYFQYKCSIDTLVSLIENKTPIDTVALPLLFLTRHSLELGLKANILTLEKVNTQVHKIILSGTKSHSLEVLYNKFEEHLNIIQKNNKISPQIRNEINQYFNEFKPLKDILHTLDKGSFAFRYPVDTTGDNTFKWNNKIQIADIINMYYKIQPLLLYTDCVLTEEGIFIS